MVTTIAVSTRMAVAAIIVTIGTTVALVVRIRALEHRVASIRSALDRRISPTDAAAIVAMTRRRDRGAIEQRLRTLEAATRTPGRA